MLLHYEAVTQTRVSRAGYHHGDLARESVLHVLAEQFDWLQRWCG